MQGYVLQDDVLPGTSTVWEYLTFHAALRLPRNTSTGAKAARVQAIIDQLSLAKVIALKLSNVVSNVLLRLII